MNIERLKKRLLTSLFGENIFYYEEIGSTNEKAMQLAKEGAPEGTIVIAEYQSSGKGRLDRQWLSPKGENLLVSILLRPELEVELVRRITLASATVIISSLKGFLRNRNIQIPQLEVKWPNDVLISGKKMGGVLAESRLKDKYIEALVLGIGLNLNMEKADIPEQLRNSASTLKAETGHHFIREDFLAFFLKEFEKMYEKEERTSYSDTVRKWKKNCRQFGCPLLIHTPEGDEKGVFEDIDDNGYLIYETEDGLLKTLVAGEIERV